MSREFTKVICIRVNETTYDKLLRVQDKMGEDVTTSEAAREALIRGIAKMEVEKNVK